MQLKIEDATQIETLLSDILSICQCKYDRTLLGFVFFNSLIIPAYLPILIIDPTSYALLEGAASAINVVLQLTVISSPEVEVLYS